VTALLNGGADR